MSFPILTPLINPFDFAVLMTILNTSLIMINKKYDNGSPCLHPFYILKGSVGHPFTKIEMDALLIHHMSPLIILEPNPT